MTTKFEENLFFYGLITSYILYFFALLGIYNKAPEYLETLSMVLKTYVSLFLIIKFNPYTKHNFNEFDRKVAYAAGFFLFFTTTVSEIVSSYLKPIVTSKIEKIKDELD